MRAAVIRLLRTIGWVLALSAAPGGVAGAESSPGDRALAAGTAAYLRANFQEAALQMEAAAAADQGAIRTSALTRLGSIRSMQGRYREAESALLDARQAAVRVYGERHANTGKISVMLGSVRLEQGRYPEAETAYLQALQVLQPLYGTDHPDVAACLSGLAELSWQMGNNEESLRRFWRAYMVSSYLYGQDSSKVSDLLAQLSKIYMAKGLSAEAQALIARAVKIGDKPLQANRPWDRLDEHELLLLLPSEREYTATRGQMQVKTRDSEHPEYARYYDYLASLNLTAGRYAESEKSFRRAIAIRERAFGRSHPEVAASQAGLALGYKLRGDTQAALDLTRTASASLARRIGAFALSGSQYAQGERRRWRPVFLQLLALLGERPASMRSEDEFFSALQFANPVDVSEAALEMAARAAPRDLGLVAETGKRVGVQEPITLAEVQTLLQPNEALAAYVRGPHAVFVALVSKTRVDVRMARSEPDESPLAPIELDLAGLRQVFVVPDRRATHGPFVTLPSVAALRAVRRPAS